MKTITQLQKYTKLNLRVVEIPTQILPDILIETPHKGVVQIKLKDEHYPFLFGSATQTDRHAKDIINEIRKTEEEAKDFLLERWLKETNQT